MKERPFRIGSLKMGKIGNIDFVYGELEVSKPLAVPIIREVKRKTNKDKLVIIDSPPGASDPVIASVSGSDFTILVTEPTPFGLHDLKIAVDILEQLKIPFGVVVNRANLGDTRVYNFCKEKNIPILLEIPYSHQFNSYYLHLYIFFHTILTECPIWCIV
jgi:MinD superfamily P-loop ATPase